jgi:hypothetical protein
LVEGKSKERGEGEENDGRRGVGVKACKRRSKISERVEKEKERERM